METLNCLEPASARKSLFCRNWYFLGLSRQAEAETVVTDVVALFVSALFVTFSYVTVLVA